MPAEAGHSCDPPQVVEVGGWVVGCGWGGGAFGIASRQPGATHGAAPALAWIMQWCGVTVTPGMRCMIRCAAISAFDRPTSRILRPLRGRTAPLCPASRVHAESAAWAIGALNKSISRPSGPAAAAPHAASSAHLSKSLQHERDMLMFAAAAGEC